MELTVVILEYIGVASAAITGTMVGIEKRADAFGVLFLAMVTALGGGIMRDIFLGEFPPRMFTSFIYIAMVTFFSLVVFADACVRGASYRAHKDRLDAVNNFFDAIGLRLQDYVSSDLTGIIPYAITIIMMVYVVIRGQQKKKHAAKRLPDPALKT